MSYCTDVNLQEEHEEFGVNMKIKYRLIYEWMSDESDILDCMNANECSIKEAINNSIQWNQEEFADRLNDYGMRILGLEGQFEYEVI